MKVKSGDASDFIKGTLESFKRLESDFLAVSGEASRGWTDLRQKQFFGKYVSPIETFLGDCKNELNSLVHEVRGLETTLKSTI